MNNLHYLNDWSRGYDKALQHINDDLVLVFCTELDYAAEVLTQPALSVLLQRKRNLTVTWSFIDAATAAFLRNTILDRAKVTNDLTKYFSRNRRS